MEGTRAPSLQFADDLIPHLVDQRKISTPQKVYAEYPVSTSTYSEGYRKITYHEFANAVNGAAKWLVDTLGRGTQFETLAYIGPNDIRYPVFILGAVKAGYKLFLPSPRNSTAAQFSLFARLDCKVLLSTEPRPAAVRAITEHEPFRVVEIPTVSYLLDTDHAHFPYDASWPEARSEPLFVVHTSGSTGLPKPLIYTHATAAANIKMMSLDPPAGFGSQNRVYRGKKVFVAFPPFHGAYLVLHFFDAVPFGTVIISPTSGNILTGSGLVESLEQNPADIAFIVPSIVQDLAQSPKLLEYCSHHLAAIIYCGGDLPQAIGDTVVSKIRLLNQFGASELGLTPSLLSLANRSYEDWKYVQFHPELGLELRHVADGVHELYAIRDPAKESTQPTFTIFPNAKEYASRDLFARHPSEDKPDLWTWQARADDIIVFLNGEKTNPILMEQHIVASNPDVSAALVIGAQRFQAGLLIEPIFSGADFTATERAAFIEKIWPTVEEANEVAPSHARVMKSHVLFTQPGKPMLRAGKGTVQRSGTIKAYTEEIKMLYRDAETMSSSLNSEDVDSIGTLDPEAISKCVRQDVEAITGFSDLDETADLFSLGMDSLQTLVLVRKLRQRLSMPTIALSTIYTNPSISALTAALRHHSDQDSASKTSRDAAHARRRNGMIQDYKKQIDKLVSPQLNNRAINPAKYEQEIVVLTGSTGTLGSYILDALLRNETVEHVYCLNRAKDSLMAQTRKNQLFGLQEPSTSRKTSFLTIDMRQQHFGLENGQYDELMNRTTLIIHNAWTVDFNLPLASFKPQLDNLCHFLDFAIECAHRPRFFYMSSISSVMSHRPSTGKTPEALVTADAAPGPNGYAESKYIAEQIIDHVAQGLPRSHSFAFARVGQIAGATRHSGLWNKSEWFPSMIIGSLHIGALPDSLGSTFGSIDWVPVDSLGDIISELSMSRSKSMPDGLISNHPHADVYHPLNPSTIPWADLKPIVLDELNSRREKPMEVVPLRTWIAQVRKEAEVIVDRGENGDNMSVEAELRKVPAAKLLSFYEHMAEYDMVSSNGLEHTDTLKLSATMQKLEPIKAAWVKKWIREWFVD